MNRRLSRRGVLSGAAATAAVGMTGCLQNPDPNRGGGGGSDAYVEGDVPGPGSVTVLGAFGGQEEEAFRASLAPFEEETGITVNYTPDQDFTTTIQQRVNSGDAPDVALFPQPGGLFDLAAKGTSPRSTPSWTTTRWTRR
ncbi:MAG: extracellular solute-binding protein [Brachybacterium sp.]|uniref:extracellular solute-binding protein n=1 Tax=Microbacterium sp. TaxID=51671 RepID=UPI003F9E5A01